MIVRTHRWSRRLLVTLAAMPLFQAVGGCDAVLASVASQFVSGTFNLFVGSVQAMLLQNFPSMDILQILLGANRQPFFP